MDQKNGQNLTAIIKEVQAGSADAKARLIQALYWEIYRIAEAMMRRERPGHTLQPTALVNEAMLRLLDGEVIEKAPNRRYLFGAAARAMRQALVDHARRRPAYPRDGKRVPLDDVLAFFEEQNLDFLQLNEALDRLTAIHERPGLVVVLRFFVGLPVAKVAEALDVSIGTVEADWRFARAWLRDQLERGIE